ncbi:undecaprenyl phosphate-alpha-L-ara4N flippase subunit ArnE [Paenibacillus forsythiae]|uniref:Undecaprenyl phosphate-alpha-L-ara4N flippase subunit ArnE n=1 Tax=Paenibacillus forsythiae TaxID=365616 RepID=A0ABU3HAU3_9BACL|nr:DMT family transporter [Paenibacillus forsythiae]MDT3427930.1 undecaprenyl phosphate-alpha-L-ara4N flippase subunit ArnE [Paenibacillus forsythiae]
MKNEPVLYALLLVMTLFGSLGSVFFKGFTSGKRYALLLLGFASYGIGALLNIYLLGKLPYTLVMPANALTFLWALLFAKIFFKETVGILKIAGVVFIISGLLLLLW